MHRGRRVGQRPSGEHLAGRRRRPASAGRDGRAATAGRGAVGVERRPRHQTRVRERRSDLVGGARRTRHGPARRTPGLRVALPQPAPPAPAAGTASARRSLRQNASWTQRVEARVAHGGGRPCAPASACTGAPRPRPGWSGSAAMAASSSPSGLCCTSAETGAATTRGRRSAPARCSTRRPRRRAGGRRPRLGVQQQPHRLLVLARGRAGWRPRSAAPPPPALQSRWCCRAAAHSPCNDHHPERERTTRGRPVEQGPRSTSRPSSAAAISSSAPPTATSSASAWRRSGDSWASSSSQTYPLTANGPAVAVSSARAGQPPTSLSSSGGTPRDSANAATSSSRNCRSPSRRTTASPVATSRETDSGSGGREARTRCPLRGSSSIRWPRNSPAGDPRVTRWTSSRISATWRGAALHSASATATAAWRGSSGTGAERPTAAKAPEARTERVVSSCWQVSQRSSPRGTARSRSPPDPAAWSCRSQRVPPPR